MIADLDYLLAALTRPVPRLFAAALLCASPAVAQQAPLLRLDIKPSQVDAELASRTGLNADRIDRTDAI
jgi:hypothetical protein